MRTTKPYGVVRGEALAAGDADVRGEVDSDAAGEAAGTGTALVTGVPP